MRRRIAAGLTVALLTTSAGAQDAEEIVARQADAERLSNAGDYAAALSFAEETLAAAESGLGPERPRTLFLSNNPAHVYQETGPSDTAEPLLAQIEAVHTDATELNVTAPGYSLVLSEDWREIPSSDPEQKTFESRSRDVQLVISSMDVSVERPDPEVAAQRLVEFRLDGERQAAERFDLKMTIAEPIIVPQPWGQAVAYYGHDDTGRTFSYSGAVTPEQILSMYIESNTLSNDELSVVFQEIFNGLTF